MKRDPDSDNECTEYTGLGPFLPIPAPFRSYLPSRSLQLNLKLSQFRAEDSFDLGLRSGPTRVAHAHSRPTTRSWAPSGAPIRSAEPGAGSHPTQCGAAHQEVHPQRCGPAAPAQFFMQKRADCPSDLR